MYAHHLTELYRQEYEMEKFDEQTKDLYKKNLANSRVMSILNPATFVIVNIGIIILIKTDALKVYYGLLTQGQVVALINYMSQILVELFKLFNLIITINKGFACYERIETVFKLHSDVGITEDVYGVTPGREGEDMIRFEDVEFSYPESKEGAVKGISFSLKPGQTIGFIGGTGSGKSTLFKLILGHYSPEKGKISKNITREDIGYVPQNPVLFAGTIRENLDITGENIDDETMIWALKAAYAYEFVESKGGLDAGVEKDGRNFSGGQKQRICIARALLKKPKLLMVDDGFSALDTVTERAVESVLNRMSDMSKLIISQRVGAVKNADSIIVMDDGLVCGSGTHDTLIKTCEQYRDIAESGGVL